MQRQLLYLLLCILFIACNEQAFRKPVPTAIYEVDTNLLNRLQADSLIRYYLKNTQNPVVIDGLDNQWFWKKLEKNNKGTFVVAQLGGCRGEDFMGNAWLFIDTTTKGVYEYDTAKNTLTLWNK